MDNQACIDSSPVCSGCSREVPADADRCPHCQLLLKNYRVCPECHSRTSIEAERCSNCGAAATNPAIPPPVPVKSSDPSTSSSTLRVVGLPPKHEQGSSTSRPPAVPGVREVPGSHSALHPDRSADRNIDLTIGATFFGALFATGSVVSMFRPPEVRLLNNELISRTWSILGLAMHQDKVPLETIVAVRYEPGTLWGSVLVETSSPQREIIEFDGLNKTHAREFASVLERRISNSSYPAPPGFH